MHLPGYFAILPDLAHGLFADPDYEVVTYRYEFYAYVGPYDDLFTPTPYGYVTKTPRAKGRITPTP